MSLALPALSESRLLRRVAFTLLYFAQGIPEGIIFFALPAYLAMQGVEAVAIAGFISLAILPWTLKLLNAPVMDRFAFLPMGRRRPWVLFGQLGLILSFAGLSLIGDPVEHLGLLTAGCVAVSFFGAFQDVAVDGMVIDVAPVGEQAQINGWMWGGKTVGIAASTAIGAWLINAFDLGVAVLALAVSIALIMLIPLLARERPGERLLPWSRGVASPATKALQLEGWSDIGRSLLRVFILPMSLIVAVISFAGGTFRGFINALFPVFTVQELGWTDTDYSELMAAVGLVAGIGGMLIGGWLVDRMGHRKALAVFLATLAGISAVAGVYPAVWSVPMAVPAFLYTAVIFDTLFAIALFATAMAVCWRRVSATQFCLYMAISNLGMSTGAAIFGGLSENLEYTSLFFVLTAIAAATAAISLFVYITPHLGRVSILDREMVTEDALSVAPSLQMTPTVVSPPHE